MVSDTALSKGGTNRKPHPAVQHSALHKKTQATKDGFAKMQIAADNVQHAEEARKKKEFVEQQKWEAAAEQKRISEDANAHLAEEKAHQEAAKKKQQEEAVRTQRAADEIQQQQRAMEKDASPKPSKVKVTGLRPGTSIGLISPPASPATATQQISQPMPTDTGQTLTPVQKGTTTSPQPGYHHKHQWIILEVGLLLNGQDRYGQFHASC